MVVRRADGAIQATGGPGHLQGRDDRGRCSQIPRAALPPASPGSGGATPISTALYPRDLDRVAAHPTCRSSCLPALTGAGAVRALRTPPAGAWAVPALANSAPVLSVRDRRTLHRLAAEVRRQALVQLLCDLPDHRRFRLMGLPRPTPIDSDLRSDPPGARPMRRALFRPHSSRLIF